MSTWREWLTDNVALLTAAGYARDVRLYGAQGPETITRVDVREYVARLRAQGYAPRSINRRVEALRAYVRWGMETGALAVDPLEHIESEALPEADVKWLERKEWGRIERELELQTNGARTQWARIMAARDTAAIMLMRYAGLRVAEVCALTLMDVALDGERTVHVRHGKGDKPRSISLHAEAARALTDWLALRPNGGEAFLFIGKRGERMESRGVQRRMEEIARRANVPGCTPHTLRHTFAHELIVSGVALTVVQKLLGHARLDTTAIYTVPGAADLRAAVEALP